MNVQQACFCRCARANRGTDQLAISVYRHQYLKVTAINRSYWPHHDYTSTQLLFCGMFDVSISGNIKCPGRMSRCKRRNALLQFYLWRPISRSVTTDHTTHVIESPAAPEAVKNVTFGVEYANKSSVFVTDVTIKAVILHVAAHDMMILVADAVVPLPTSHVNFNNSPEDLWENWSTAIRNRRTNYSCRVATPFDTHVLVRHRPRTPMCSMILDVT